MNFYPHNWLAALLPLRLAFDKTRAAADSHVSQIEQALPVRCGQCRAMIARSQDAMEMLGAHAHVFSNPAGVVFQLQTYRIAQCEMSGLLTAEYSWFPGYAWQLAHCPQCYLHLGWRYTQLQFPDFYGLIATRLIIDAL